MSSTQTSSGLASVVESLAAGDPAWLATVRRDAWARFESLPLPSRVEHLWRYTDPQRLLPGARMPGARPTSFGELPEDFHDGIFENAAAYAICRDAVLLRSTVDPLLVDRGLVIDDLLSAARRRPELVRPRLLALSSEQDAGAKFDALSAALFAGGTFVHVPDDSAIDLPIRVAHRVSGTGLVAARSLVVVGARAKATLVFDLTTEDQASPQFHEATEVFVGPGASLRLVFVQTFSRAIVHAPIVRARVERDATLETVTLALGGAVTKSLQTAVLAEPGARTKVQGIVFADGRAHFDHHTFQDHVAPNTSSELDYRTVAGDRARSAYTGRLRIAKTALGADAHQRNHNLLLSDTARADTIPELEILTNEVKCSHAAAVGPIDEEQVFFCTSRGLSPADARRLIVLGFLESAVAGVPGETLQNRVRGALEKRLSEMR
jgi:Fe-S cluster assembly protein SufD